MSDETLTKLRGMLSLTGGNEQFHKEKYASIYHTSTSANAAEIMSTMTATDFHNGFIESTDTEVQRRRL